MGVQINGDTGNVSATKGTYSSNLTVGGVLTFEDVTNVDSIGIVTARTDINLGDSIIHIDDTNTKIRFPEADTISAETGGSERLRITSGGRVNIGDRTTSPDELVHIHTASGEANVHVEAATNANLNLRSHSGDSTIQFSDASASNVGNINYDHGTDSLSFRTNSGKRLTITSDGDIEVQGESSSSPYPVRKLKWSNDSTTTNGFYIAQHSDRDARIWHEQGLALSFGTNNTERFRITSDGKVGINDNDPDLTLHVKDGDLSGRSAANSNCDVLIEGTDNTGIQFYSGTQTQLRFGDAASTAAGAIIYQHSDDQFKFNYNSSGSVTFNSSSTARMTLDSSGRVLIDTTSEFGGANAKLQVNGQDVASAVFNRTTNGTIIGFKRGSSSDVGTISVTASSTAYNESSDYRLKENVTAISDGITRLKTLKPSRFNFKVDKDKTVDGFLAHEVTVAVPEAITGTKDEVDSDNNPVYQGIDKSKLVPLLTAALQEAIAKIETLETKVAALEAN